VPELYSAPHSSHETASTILRPPINTGPKRKTKRFYKKEDEEKLLRIQKIKEAIKQQNELHQIRMASAMEEFFVATANAKLVASKLKNEQLQEVQKNCKRTIY
jgi:DNA-binding transcriptional MerR regulator